MTATELQLGCYTRNTAFNVIQHSYAAAPTGYIQALEVTEAPEEFHPIVFMRYSGWVKSYEFVELDTVKDAVRETNRLRWGGALKTGSDHPFDRWREVSAGEYYAAQPGFRRYVKLEPGQLPWFYAPDRTMVTPGCDFVMPE